MSVRCGRLVRTLFMDYINTVALWMGYAWLTLAAVRCVIGGVLLTRQSIIDLHVALRTKFTDATLMAIMLEEKKAKQPEKS